MGRLSCIIQVDLKCYHKHRYKREGEGDFTAEEKENHFTKDAEEISDATQLTLKRES